MAEPSPPPRINLVGWDNGRGLSHDIRLLRDTLQSLGYQVHFTAARPGRRRRPIAMLRLRMQLLRQWWRGGRHGSWRFDANIMLEHVRPDCFSLARRNLFIPNPEWLSPRDQRHLHRFDAVLAKTRVATKTFEARGLRTLYIGFRSCDRQLVGTPRETGFLHLAGASRMKGTARLLALWQRHPEWPHLLVLQSPQTAAAMPPVRAANIEHRIATLPDIHEIRQLQNSRRFHLCLSEAEGWGHYIAEAMSCAAVVITCDAAPMNELVEPDRGLLVDAAVVGPMNAATRHRFDEASLTSVIEHATRLDAGQCERIGAAARAWFEANQREFPARLQDALQQVL